MDTNNWGVININTIFDISYGNKLDMCQMTPLKEGIPFVTRTATNNGVGGIVEPIEGISPYPAGSLSIALGGSIGSTFLQTKDFYTSQNVAVLQPKHKLSNDVLLFLATLIEKECNLRFIAFGRELNKHIKRDFTINLPLLPDGIPDWEEVEQTIQNIISPQLPEKAKKVWQKQYDITPLSPNKLALNTKEWQWFKVGDWFKVVAGKYHYQSEYSEGSTPYLSATTENNGIGNYIDLEAEFDKDAVTTEKVACTSFYQPFPFCATSDVNILRRKDNVPINKYVGLFLASIIDFNENYRWCYGRQCRIGDTKAIRMKLPAILNAQGEYEPDWQWMEDYIKGLPYSKCL